MNSVSASLPESNNGQIIAAFGRQFLVELSNGETLPCILRGKKSNVVCGDWVKVKRLAAEQGVIESISPRSSLLYRSNTVRKKIIAANITQIIIVLAVIPSFDEELLNRCLIAAENQNIKSLIILNKIDLNESTCPVLSSLHMYQKIGYTFIQLSAKIDIRPLLPHLQNHLSILVGQSGVGKSTITNALIPNAKRATAKISDVSDSGRHTTTHTKLYHVNKSTHIIDSPGIQEFGLHHISKKSLAWEFKEFQPYLGQCKFSDCLHLSEPDCALDKAAIKNNIDVRRLELYRKLVTSSM